MRKAPLVDGYRVSHSMAVAVFALPSLQMSNAWASA